MASEPKSPPVIPAEAGIRPVERRVDRAIARCVTPDPA